MKNISSPTKLVQVLFFAKAGILFLFAFVLLFFYQTAMSNVLTVLMVIDATIFFCVGMLLGKKIKWVFWFAIMFLGVNIILTIFDQLGMIDFVVLGIDVVILALLLKNKKTFVG